jgi:copper chaperone NosL
MTRLPVTSRLLVALGALLMLGAFFHPLWRIDLEAPQYPEGLGMLIHVDAVGGVQEHDLTNINTLNHYIGMKAIESDAIPELRYMPWILGALVAGGLAAAAAARRGAVLTWLGAIVLMGLAGLADFYRWGYDYGHDIDPQAIIAIPGMTYQPPLIGSKQLLNITAHSWPAGGAWLIAAGAALAVAALWLARRQSRAMEAR